MLAALGCSAKVALFNSRRPIVIKKETAVAIQGIDRALTPVLSTDKSGLRRRRNRSAMSRRRPSGTLRWLFRVPVFLYSWRCGWLLRHRFLLLIHVGRHTGRRRETVLEIVEYRKEGPEAVVISAFGPGADWLRNIAASPNLEVVIGSKHFTATYRVIGEDESVGVLVGYQRRNRFIAPIVRLGFSWLLGWKFDGSEEHRRRLAAQLPFIAFRPRSGQSKKSE